MTKATKTDRKLKIGSFGDRWRSDVGNFLAVHESTVFLGAATCSRIVHGHLAIGDSAANEFEHLAGDLPLAFAALQIQ